MEWFRYLDPQWLGVAVGSLFAFSAFWTEHLPCMLTSFARFRRGEFCDGLFGSCDQAD